MPPGITTSSLCSLDNHTNEWHINSNLYKRIRDQGVYLAHENLAESDPVIIPYKVINSIFTTLYGIITGLLPAGLPRFSERDIVEVKNEDGSNKSTIKPATELKRLRS